jgi:acyl carrier protein
MPPSIGRPISNTYVYILDERLQPVASGEPGEIYIGGVGVARGYLNRPELTAEKFITNPFSNKPDARLYKTGDLARYLPDGQIAFLGRIDHQVKIRGFRIELGEIESVLLQHSAVNQTVVTAREDVPGEKYLVAYVVLDQSQHATSDELHSFLKEWLPDYMIPMAFVFLEVLPLTPNGKLDRAALPPPGSTNALPDEFIAASLIEERLAEIMAGLLGLQLVGKDDNFFMLGGNSLLAAQVILRVTEEFGIDLSLYRLFEAPTVRELSAEIERCIVARLETMSEDEINLL